MVVLRIFKLEKWHFLRVSKPFLEAMFNEQCIFCVVSSRHLVKLHFQLKNIYILLWGIDANWRIRVDFHDLNFMQFIQSMGKVPIYKFSNSRGQNVPKPERNQNSTIGIEITAVDHMIRKSNPFDNRRKSFYRLFIDYLSYRLFIDYFIDENSSIKIQPMVAIDWIGLASSVRQSRISWWLT